MKTTEAPVAATVPNQVPTAPDAGAPGNLSVADLAGKMSRKRAARPAPQPVVPAPAAAEAPAPSEHAQEAEETVLSQSESEIPGEPPAAEVEQVAETAEEPAEPGEQEPEQGQEPKSVRELQKRVGKLTAQLNQTQDLLKKANNLAQQGQSDPGGPPPEAFNGDKLVQAINQDLRVANAALDFVDENPEGGTFKDPNTGAERFYDAAQVRKIRRNAEQTRTELLTERSTYLSELRRADATARKQYEGEFSTAYPKFVEEGSPEAEEFATTLAQAPELKRFPDFKLWVADAVAGRRARLARTSAAARVTAPMTRPKGAAIPPKVVAQTGGLPARIDPKSKALQEADQEFQKSGSTKDLAQVFARKRASQLVRT